MIEAVQKNNSANLLKSKLAELATNYPLSDIHLHSNKPIAIRVNGDIERVEGEYTSHEDIENFINAVLDDETLEQFHKMKQADFAITSDGIRFRVNAYLTTAGPAIVMRKIDSEIPPIEKLGLPDAMKEIVHQENGLVLVTGPTGSGKSTSLAALIGQINQDRKGNIITVEDPIEFVHSSRSCIVSQREVGRDAVSFASALKAMLREDPDIILVGEMRDMETISLALTAAETGHLVFATLHTNGAANSVNRIIDVFPSEQQSQVRSQLSQSLRLVVTQQLIKRADGSGRVAAFEVMVNNNAIGNLIRENKIFQIDQAIQTGRQLGMMTMEDSVKELIMMGVINEDDIQYR